MNGQVLMENKCGHISCQFRRLQRRCGRLKRVITMGDDSAQAPCRGLSLSLLAGGRWCGTANSLHRRCRRPPLRLTHGNELPGTGITSNFLWCGFAHVVLSSLSPEGMSTIRTASKRTVARFELQRRANLSRFRSLPGLVTGRRGHRGCNLGALRFLTWSGAARTLAAHPGALANC
mgnify:CR=1 FL=1